MRTLSSPPPTDTTRSTLTSCNNPENDPEIGRTNFTIKDREEATSKEAGRTEMQWGVKQITGLSGGVWGQEGSTGREGRDTGPYTGEPTQGR